MRLSDRQKRFAYNFYLLQEYIYTHYPEIEIVFGEAQRTAYQQEEYLRLGLTKTLYSKHLIKCAKDVDYWHRGDFMGDMPKDEQKRILQPLGDFWESLDIRNEWGGNWTEPFDPRHYQG